MYDYSIHRTINGPHNPQWSFVEDKCCERAEYHWRKKMAADKCEVQCAHCKRICEFNDYIRGVKPMDKPNYLVPAIRYEVEFQYDRVILWTKLKSWDYFYLASTY